MVYAQNINPQTAIQQIRLKRPLSVQTKKQVQFVTSFQKYLYGLRNVFPGIELKTQTEAIMEESISFQDLIEKQKKYLHGIEQRNMRCVPKVEQKKTQLYYYRKSS